MELAGGVDILVATPGRLIDLCRSRAVTLERTEFLVLDEADRMLDLGFVHDVRRIVAMMPKKRQTLLFSATMPSEIADLAEELLCEPVRVGVNPSGSTVAGVDQRVLFVSREEKVRCLAETLQGEPIDRALVFTRTKRGADKLVRLLAKSGVTAEAIHGDKSQGQRDRALAGFRAGRVRNLVATDIAARGIDVTGITHVVNYDMPNDPESYVHRIGRTARAGRPGTAISLCSADELPYLRSIEKLTAARSVPHPAARRLTKRFRRGPMAAAPPAERPRHRVAASGAWEASAQKIRLNVGRRCGTRPRDGRNGKPRSAPRHGGATSNRRASPHLRSHADQLALKKRREELKSSFLPTPAGSWDAAVAKTRYLLTLFAETPTADDPRYRTLVEQVFR